MNKAELVEEVASQTGLTKRMCREAIDAITSTISDSLASGEKVTLVGFGSFKVRERKARRTTFGFSLIFLPFLQFFSLYFLEVFRYCFGA